MMADHGDRAAVVGVARYGRQGGAWSGDGVPLRARRPPGTEAGEMARGSDGDPEARGGIAEARAADDAALVRGIAGPLLRSGALQGASFFPWVGAGPCPACGARPCAAQRWPWGSLPRRLVPR